MRLVAVVLLLLAETSSSSVLKSHKFMQCANIVVPAGSEAKEIRVLVTCQLWQRIAGYALWLTCKICRVLSCVIIPGAFRDFLMWCIVLYCLVLKLLPNPLALARSILTLVPAWISGTRYVAC